MDNLLTQQRRSPHASNGGPPAPGPFESITRHPWLTLLPIFVLVAGALALGLLRDPVYTSNARLGVGSLSPAQGDQPSVEANQQLAATYSRAIDAEPVVRRASRRSGLPRGEVLSSLSASALPKSPLLKVEATAKDRERAVLLARTGGEALTRYVSNLTGSGSGSRVLLGRFKRAQADAAAAAETAQLARGARKAAAEAEAEAAALKAKALKTAYVQQETGSGAGTPLRVLSPAERASSDASQKLKLYLVIGALAGVLLGVGLATARSALRAR